VDRSIDTQLFLENPTGRSVDDGRDFDSSMCEEFPGILVYMYFLFTCFNPLLSVDYAGWQQL